MNPKNKQHNIYAGLIVLAFLGFACNSNLQTPNAVNVSSKNTSNMAANQVVKKPLSDFEEKLNYVRNGRFTYIYAFTRKDGKAFNSETKDYVRTFSDPQTNQWVITEDEKTVVAGSNFRFQPVNFEALLKIHRSSFD